MTNQQPHNGRRRFLKQALAGAILTSASASGFLSNAGRALAQTKPEKVTVQLNWFKSTQQGGHFVALEKGFFKEEGIELEMIQGGPGVDSIGLVASGRAMIGERDSSNIILARAKGIPIRAFAAYLQKSPFAMFSLKSKPILSVKEMEGKTIAIPTNRRGPLTAVLKRAGIDASKVRFVPTANDASILANGQVDAYCGFLTNEALGLRLKGIELAHITLDDMGDVTYSNVSFATDETLATKSDVLVRWLRAEIKGWDWMAQHPEQAARIALDKYLDPGQNEALQIEQAKLYADFIRGDGKQPLLWVAGEVFDASKRLALEAGSLKEDISTDLFFTQNILKKAHQLR